MKIKKQEIKFKDRLKRELLIRVIPWGVFSTILIWVFLRDLSGNFSKLIILSGLFLGFLLMIQTAFKWSKYQIVEANFSQDNFSIKFLDKNEIKIINSNKDEVYEIKLKNHSWGIFPLSPKKKVNYIILENQNSQIKLLQSKSKSWKSSELHNLYYKGFQFHYYKYWVNKFEIKFEN